ncbi:hypothetical protein BRC20_01380 [Candidatus Saccharibacteria bacterium QS_8_54_8]|nr:MAG: hypothetical protein BRC20_01380 [Candidatus Saccharibacteria bacterium QS_8_54_8]
MPEPRLVFPRLFHGGVQVIKDTGCVVGKTLKVIGIAFGKMYGNNVEKAEAVVYGWWMYFTAYNPGSRVAVVVNTRHTYPKFFRYFSTPKIVLFLLGKGIYYDYPQIPLPQ